jgi:hypothetical protein
MVDHPVPTAWQILALNLFDKKFLWDLDPEGRQIIGHLLRIQMNELLENAERKMT